MITLLRDPICSAAVDRPDARFFIPEEMTPLAHTSLYCGLSPTHRLRYNQIFGLYFLEQTIFFEQCMGRPLLEVLEQKGPLPLRSTAREFIDEENRHTSWFRELLRECEPDWYPRDGFRLVQPGRIARDLLEFCTARPGWFPCLLWLQLMAEERALAYGRAFVRDAAALDERFVAVQRRHLEDEGDHIRWDAEFIEALWPLAKPPVRSVNARLLRWVLGEFFRLPKRSGWNVTRCWLSEFPELKSRTQEFREAMVSLERNLSFVRTLYPRTMFPRTRRLASRWPEMHIIEEIFTG